MIASTERMSSITREDSLCALALSQTLGSPCLGFRDFFAPPFEATDEDASRSLSTSITAASRWLSALRDEVTHITRSSHTGDFQSMLDFASRVVVTLTKSEVLSAPMRLVRVSADSTLAAPGTSALNMTRTARPCKISIGCERGSPTCVALGIIVVCMDFFLGM